MPNLTDIYFRNADAFDEGHSLIINQGGQGSSKTYSILQNIYDILKYSIKPLVASVCSYALPHLKMGAVRELYKILTEFGENPEAIHNKSDHYFRIGNSILEYFGIRDNISRAIGPRRDLLFVNEAINKITYNDFDQLYQRTNLCTWVDYNPRFEFWIHDKVIPNFRHKFIKSTFRDNPWLPEPELLKILWKAGKPEFAAWWRVYGEGEIGILEDTIFPNWDYGEFDTERPYGFGLDFGFHPDPDAMLKEAIDKKNHIIYMDECFYSPGLMPSELIESVGAHAKRSDRIIADSSNPRMIRMLSKDFNIKGVKKTGTKAEWIRLMQDYKFIITEGSYNLAKELNNYMWKDKKAGIPEDGWDHLCDAALYFFMDQTQTRAYTKAV